MESAQNDHRRTAVERETTSAAGGKRKRSPSPTVPVHVRPPSGLSKGHHETVEIDYLARRYADDLLLVSGDESLPNILSLIDEYEGVLQRHESMAANLGAKPLGQTLMKRFERIFDGPVKIVQSHGKESVRVSWLDVVEMYRNKPQDFVIVETRSGGRVCQLWSKGCKVEISEDDFTLIKSGMPQKLIPPQPIHEDEEKELGTLEILEKRLLHVIGLTDAVSGKARKLNLRLRARKSAIVGGRTLSMTGGNSRSAPSVNGTGTNFKDQSRSSHSPTAGFVAVNSRQSSNGIAKAGDAGTDVSPVTGVSATTHADLLRRFSTLKETKASPAPTPSRPSASRSNAPNATPAPSPGEARATAPETIDYANVLLNSASSVPIPSTPSTLLLHKGSPAQADDGGPYKARMVVRVERLEKGDVIEPPCDRCRRLRMECQKNLTACMGCTRKHAKCSWKDVKEDELLSEPEGGSEGSARGEAAAASEDGEEVGAKKTKGKSKSRARGSLDRDKALDHEQSDDHGSAKASHDSGVDTEMTAS